MYNSTGAVTGVGFTTSATLGTGWVWADPALKMRHSGRANFDTQPTNSQQFTINGLRAGESYKVWIASGNVLGSQRSAGEWSTPTSTTSANPESVSNIDNLNGDTREEGNIPAR